MVTLQDLFVFEKRGMDPDGKVVGRFAATGIRPKFYEKLLSAVADSDLREGEWQLCECTGWPDNPTAEQLLAWCWHANGRRHLVVVNLASGDAQARVRLPWSDLAGRTWHLRDALTGDTFDRDGGELGDEGLYVGMGPWQSYFLALVG